MHAKQAINSTFFLYLLFKIIYRKNIKMKKKSADSYILQSRTRQLKLLKKKKILKLFLRAEKKLEKLKFFRKSSQCLIGVSGGQDSICLGIFIRSLQRKWKLKVEFIYCHHAWQQENFHTLMQITKYAAYTDYGYYIFLNPKSSNSLET